MKIQNYKKLLFENLGIRQTVAKNSFWLILAEVIIRFLGLVLIIYAARILGATGYGKFTFALSFVMGAVVLADLGLSDITTRELSGKRVREKDFSAILSLKILLSIITLILMVGGSFFISSDPVIQRTIWTLSLFILISSFLGLFYGFLRARQRMEYEAGMKILQALLITGLGIFILFKLPSVENLSYIYLLANLIVLFLVLLFFHFYIYPLGLRRNYEIWKRFLSISWPLTLGFIPSWIYVNIDSVMLGYFGLVRENGWFNAASKIALVVIASAGLISKSFYPVLSKLFKESKEGLQRAWSYQMEVMIVLATPLVLGGIVLAPRIINLFYDFTYSPSVLAFQFLIFIAGLSFLYFPYSMVLVVSEQQKKHFFLIIAGVLINILFGLFLIPRYSLYGAAGATIISLLITLLLVILFSKYFTPIHPFNLKLFKVFLGASISGLIMFMILRQPPIYNLHLFPLIFIGGTVYSLSYLGARKLLIH